MPAVALAACGFGAISVLAKSAYEAGSSPMSLLSSRLVIAALVLAPVALPRVPSLWRSLGWGPLARAGLAGAAFSTAGFLEFEGLSRLPAPTLVLLLFLAPVWVAIGSHVLLGRRLGRSSAAMLAIVLMGIALLVGSPEAGGLDAVGVALGVAASILYAAVFLLFEDLARGPGPVLATGLIGIAAALGGVIVEPTGVRAELADPARGWYAVSVGGLTAGSLLLLAVGLETASAFTASVVSAVEPLAAALLSWIFLGELLSAIQMAGALAVIGGVVGMTCRQ
jgi:drug/metabolite transporter (DMT)-like permease